MKNDNKYLIIQVKKGRQSVILRTGWKGIDNMKKYQTFDEMFNDDEMVSPEDREQINLEVALIGKMVESREARGLSQRELAEISGVKQPAIARIESMKSTPQLDTLLKVLVPLGYTLKIVPLKPNSHA